MNNQKSKKNEASNILKTKIYTRVYIHTHLKSKRFETKFHWTDNFLLFRQLKFEQID